MFLESSGPAAAGCGSPAVSAENMHTTQAQLRRRRPRWIGVLSTSLQRAFAHTCVGDQAAIKGCHAGQQSAYWTKENIMRNCRCERSALCMCVSCRNRVHKTYTRGRASPTMPPSRRYKSSKAQMTSPDLLSPRIRRHVRDGCVSTKPTPGEEQARRQPQHQARKAQQCRGIAKPALPPDTATRQRRQPGPSTETSKSQKNKKKLRTAPSLRSHYASPTRPRSSSS
jgi:hypothetical protein